MNYSEVLEHARTCSGPYCKACPVCNGKACKNTMPGPGAKGVGDCAIRNYEKWQEIRVNMDTLTENRPVDTSISLFGKTFRYPVFAGPVGAVKLHYGEKYTDVEYNDILVPACRNAGIAAFTGDGTDYHVMEAATAAIGRNDGFGIPTVKPWNKETVDQKLALIRASHAFAVAMDIDAAGLPFLKNLDPPAGRKSVAELKEIIDSFRENNIPFIVKGVMTVRGAMKAVEAGASGIIVSNHGGRVQDQCPATAEVLCEIADAVKAASPETKILVDGGLRTGVDIFKALAMGADAVVVARPYVTAVYGGQAEGVSCLTEKLGTELADTMSMCGASALSEITRDMVRL
ncbi:MAG: alpha-hydroxy-acid oxidizing protein [Eubacteriales bacterium]|nr:alpha-hydroxy-acid oxidizing protein [Eubacteriales bacterium]